MGAHDFEADGYGKTVEEAYRDCVEQAMYDCGHDPYNGTISTTQGFVHIPLEEGESEQDWSTRILDDPRVQKWESCAYRVTEDGFLFSGWAAC